MKQARAAGVGTSVDDRLAVRATAQFFIPATASLQERRPRTMKHGDTFAVFDHNGDALAGAGSPEGIYHRDTRHLSHLYLTVDGMRPLLLSSTVRDDNAVLICDLTNPEITDAGGGRLIAQDLFHIRRTRFLWNARAYERVALHNYDFVPRHFRLRIDFAADFADIFEVRGAERPRRGEAHPATVEPDAVTLSYTGLDAVRRETRLQFEPAPDEIGEGWATFAGGTGPQRAQDVLRRDPLRAWLRRPLAPPGVLRRLPRSPAAPAADGVPRRLAVVLERGVQRDRASCGLGPLHAGDRHAARAVPLRGHPVVQHHRSAATR